MFKLLTIAAALFLISGLISFLVVAAAYVAVGCIFVGVVLALIRCFQMEEAGELN